MCTVFFVLTFLLASVAQAEWLDNGNGTLVDTRTGLVWQQIDDGTSRTWKNALAYCEDLSLAGKSDWRLPNVRELRSIVDYGKYDPACALPLVCHSKNYWSSTTDVTDPFEAWIVDFGSGYVGCVRKTDQYELGVVRCVRSPTQCAAKVLLKSEQKAKVPGTDSTSLELLRVFRDKVLQEFEQGRELITLYSLHSEEALEIMKINPGLKRKTKNLIIKTLPAVAKSCINGGRLSLDPATFKKAKLLIHEYEIHANENFRGALKELRRFLNENAVKVGSGEVQIDFPKEPSGL